MAYEEKFGSFGIKNILFYDEEERDLFLDSFMEEYKDHISKINGKNMFGFFKDQNTRDKLKVLNIEMAYDDNIVSMEGYGHRRNIFPIEMRISQLFDEGRVVSYNAGDSLNRSFDVDEETKEKLDDEFRAEKKRRLDLYYRGLLEPPKYREEGMKK